MSFNGLFKFTLITVWLAVMGWLIRFEAFPHAFDPTLQGYRELYRHLPALRDSWMEVRANGQHVGYINASIEMLESDGEEQLQMSNQLLMRVKLVENQNKVELLRLINEVRLDARQNLISSETTLSFGEFSGSVTLVPVEEDERYLFTLEFNGMQLKRKFHLPEGAVMAFSIMDTGLRAVKVGRTVKIRTLDPFSLTGQMVTTEITGLSKESRQLPGESRTVEVTRMEIHAADWVLQAEVDEFGRIVSLETPFGLTFLQSEANDAMKIPEGAFVNLASLLQDVELPALFNLFGNSL